MGVLDTKVILDEFKGTWEVMKTAMDEAKAEAKKAGVETAETKQKIDTIETRMAELEVKLQRLPRLVGGAIDDGLTDKQVEAKRRKDLYFKILRQGGVHTLEDDERKQAFEWKMGPVGAREAKALALGDDTTGGFLAPPEFVADIIKGVQLISPVRNLAAVRQTTRRSVNIPIRAGVFAAQWIGEVAQRAETTGLAYSMEEIPTYEMYAEVIVSEQDLEDSAFDLEAEILANASEQFAKAEGAAFVVGDSVKKPEGYMTNPNLATDLSGNAGTIASAGAGLAGQGQGLITCFYNLKSGYAQGSSWVMNRKSVGAVRKLTDTQGRYLWEPNYQNGLNTSVGAPSTSTLLGAPVVEMPDMQDEGATNFPIAFGNFKRAYQIVDRVDMVIKRLNEKYAEQGQVAYIVRKRVGGQVVLSEAIRKYKSNNA